MAEDQNGTTPLVIKPVSQDRHSLQDSELFMFGQFSARLVEIERIMNDFKAMAVRVEDKQNSTFDSIRIIGDGMAEIRDEQADHTKKIQRIYSVLVMADGISMSAKAALPFIGIASGLYAFYVWLSARLGH